MQTRSRKGKTSKMESTLYESEKEEYNYKFRVKHTNMPSYTNTHMQSQRGRKSEWGLLLPPSGDWEPSSLRAGPVERGPDAVGLTHSFVRVGGVLQQLKHTGISRSDFI